MLLTALFHIPMHLSFNKKINRFPRSPVLVNYNCAESFIKNIMSWILGTEFLTGRKTEELALACLLRKEMLKQA